MKSCFLFGHRDAPYALRARIEQTVEEHYRQYGVCQFYVGGYGAFDRMAAAAVKVAKKRHSDIELYLLIPYHPAERAVAAPEGFDNTFYPPLERVPRRYAIVKANRYMVDTCDTIICYAAHFGNARNLLEYAQRRKGKRCFPIVNLSEH